MPKLTSLFKKSKKASSGTTPEEHGPVGKDGSSKHQSSHDTSGDPIYAQLERLHQLSPWLRKRPLKVVAPLERDEVHTSSSGKGLPLGTFCHCYTIARICLKERHHGQYEDSFSTDNHNVIAAMLEDSQQDLSGDNNNSSDLMAQQQAARQQLADSTIRSAQQQPQHPYQYCLKHIPKKLYKKLKSDHNKSRFNQAVTNLLVEANYLSKLNHPNIVQLHGQADDAALADDTKHKLHDAFFLITERIQETLEERLELWRKDSAMHQVDADCPLFIQKLAFCRDIASALEYLQERQIMVLGLNPTCIGFLASSGRLQLCDLGTCREVSALQHETSQSNMTTATSTGMTSSEQEHHQQHDDDNDLRFDDDEIGDGERFTTSTEGLTTCNNNFILPIMETGSVPRYMAPEIVTQGAAGASLVADSYSLAIIAVEVLTLQRAYISYKTGQFLVKVCMEGKRPNMSMYTHMPAPVEGILRRAWRQSVEKRWTCAQIHEGFQVMMDRLEGRDEVDNEQGQIEQDSGEQSPKSRKSALNLPGEKTRVSKSISVSEGSILDQSSVTGTVDESSNMPSDHLRLLEPQPRRSRGSRSYREKTRASKTTRTSISEGSIAEEQEQQSVDGSMRSTSTSDYGRLDPQHKPHRRPPMSGEELGISSKEEQLSPGRASKLTVDAISKEKQLLSPRRASKQPVDATSSKEKQSSPRRPSKQTQQRRPTRRGLATSNKALSMRDISSTSKTSSKKKDLWMSQSFGDVHLAEKALQKQSFGKRSADDGVLVFEPEQKQSAPKTSSRKSSKGLRNIDGGAPIAFETDMASMRPDEAKSDGAVEAAKVSTQGEAEGSTVVEEHDGSRRQESDGSEQQRDRIEQSESQQEQTEASKDGEDGLQGEKGVNRETIASESNHALSASSKRSEKSSNRENITSSSHHTLSASSAHSTNNATSAADAIVMEDGTTIAVKKPSKRSSKSKSSGKKKEKRDIGSKREGSTKPPSLRRMHSAVGKKENEDAVPGPTPLRRAKSGSSLWDASKSRKPRRKMSDAEDYSIQPDKSGAPEPIALRRAQSGSSVTGESKIRKHRRKVSDLDGDSTQQSESKSGAPEEPALRRAQSGSSADEPKTRKSNASEEGKKRRPLARKKSADKSTHNVSSGADDSNPSATKKLPRRKNSHNNSAKKKVTRTKSGSERLMSANAQSPPEGEAENKANRRRTSVNSEEFMAE